MYPEQPSQPYQPAQPEQPAGRPINNPLAVMQPGEEVICELRRHPIGLFGIYFGAAVVIILSLAAAIAAPYFITSLTAQNKLALILGAVVVIVIVALYTYVASMIYNANRWIVTSDSITQISQVGLLRKQTSQLSMANLEDVTVEQNGLFQSLFGFGLLRAETAGERSKFTFSMCPNPNDYARKIIGAHEAYIAEKPQETYTTNRPLANARAFNQPYGNSSQAPPPGYGYPPANPGQPPASYPPAYPEEQPGPDDNPRQG